MYTHFTNVAPRSQSCWWQSAVRSRGGEKVSVPASRYPQMHEAPAYAWRDARRLRFGSNPVVRLTWHVLCNVFVFGRAAVSSDERFQRNSRLPYRETLITELLQSVRLQSSVCLCLELTAPWGFRITDDGATFHIVTQGTCWLAIEGAGKLVQLIAGDCVVVPRGGARIIRDSPANSVIDLFSFSSNNPSEKGRLHCGGNGPMTRLVCGSMEFYKAAADPLLTVLPPLIHVKGSRAGRATWLNSVVPQVLEELDARGAGSQAVFARLVDIVFIQAIRAYFDQIADVAQHGWLAAIRDPQVGPALALLHTRPQEPWTVASLARRVAVSRSLFASKFARLVGEPPLHHLKRLRLNAAALRLRSTNNKLGAVAADAGYESAASFTKAFKMELGIPPGEYRRMWLKKIGGPEPNLQSRNTGIRNATTIASNDVLAQGSAWERG
jgi:AraC-like DNA-binding protein